MIRTGATVCRLHAMFGTLAPVFTGKEKEAAVKSGRYLGKGLPAGPGATLTTGALLPLAGAFQVVRGRTDLRRTP